MKLIKSLKNNKGVSVLIVSILVFGILLILGLIGVRVLLGITILMLVPFYLILDNFKLENKEKAIFSFFIGITIFPSLVYFLGFIVPFRISILIIFLTLLAVSYFLYKHKKTKLFS
jgi:apolipoprotein N-acyltransferase